ncbi:MAG: hypothetical protein ISS82_06120 [Nanoarchaeota archaeon]|nr:hypothetical protein [Nanoarchaeota archaeon]
MNKYTEKYRKIVDKLIDESFPKLKKRWIPLTEAKIFKLKYSAIAFYFLFFNWVIVHPKARKYSKASLKALFAHELAHLDLIVNMNFFEKIGFAFGWLFTKKGKEKFERDADIHLIKKGYGKERLKLEEESKKTYTKEQLKKKRQGYLTPKEVKAHIKKFKK